MKLLLLACDLVIVTVYGLLCAALFPLHVGHVVVILLFFLAVRVLALSVHDALSVGNLFLLHALRHYQPVVLVVMYLLYTALYFYLSMKEQRQHALTQENTRLQIDAQQARHYRLLQQRYENQMTLNARLQERQRIAQDVHDLLGHSVAASILQLEAARKVMPTQPERADAMVVTATDALRQGMERIRSAVHNMRAEAPDLSAQEMVLIIERFRRDSGLQVIADIQDSEQPLTPAQWEALNANLTEALGNVLRHAQASQVHISLQMLPGMVRLEVADNGVGAQDMVEGMGLSGMRQRTAALGGSLMVRGDQGMQVITLLPRKEAT
ncbi:MAG: sensor histidine kinase [Christensenellales bacterium]|jgi:signal transduction histidine kinase